MKKLLILCAFALASAFSLTAATKHALFVGVNEFTKDYDLTPLNGCVPDAYRMHRTMRDFAGFAPENMTILCNEEASKGNIQTALTGLAATVEPGDTVLFYWSSHGGYEYVSSNETESASLCAHDADYTELDMANDLGRFPSGVKLVVMIDTCQSGAMFQLNWAYLSTNKLAKAAEVSFAKRVDSILSRSKAADGMIDSREIGWLTAVSHNQYSPDGSLGGMFTTDCIIFDGIMGGRADTDKDGNISFLDLYGHARRWFTYDDDRELIEDKTPMMLHEDVLASVLARDATVAPPLPYPFKVTFKYSDFATFKFDPEFKSIEPVQFVPNGGSATEPYLELSAGSVFREWETDFSCITNDLVVTANYALVDGSTDFRTYTNAVFGVKNSLGTTINEMKALAKTIRSINGFAIATNADERGVFGGPFGTLAATFAGTCTLDRKDPNVFVLKVTVSDRDGRSYKMSGNVGGSVTNSSGKLFGLLAKLKNEDSGTELNVTITPNCIRGTYFNSLGQECQVFGSWDRISADDPLAEAVVEDYEGVYNLALDVWDCDNETVYPEAGGYLNVSVTATKARVNGMLGDGTKISVSSPLMMYTDSIVIYEKMRLCVPVIARLRSGKGSFSTVVFLRRKADDTITADFATEDSNWFASLKDSGRTSGGRVLEASEVILDGKGGLYDKKNPGIPASLATEVLSFNVPDLYVRDKPVPCVTNALPDGLEVAFAKNRFKVVSENPSRLTLSFTPSTGVMSGSFRVFYSDGSVEKSATASVYGAWVPGTGGSVFGLLSDTNPELKGLNVKRSIPILIASGEEEQEEE